MSLNITALIRTYNSDRTLQACLESLKAQTVAPRQLIIVDSGSTDDTLEIARIQGAKVISYPADEEFNYSRAINIGIERVETSYTLIVSSHVSLPAPQTLAIMTHLLSADSSRCAVSILGMAETVNEAEIATVEWSAVTKTNFVSKYGGIGIANSCNLILTELWRQCPFDENIPRAEDQKWLQYYLERGRTAVRITRPQIVYNNPYYNDTKEIRDLVTFAKYDINPSLIEWRSLWQRLRRALSALRHRNFGNNRMSFQYNIRLVWELLKVRLGVHRDTGSKYF